MEGETEVGLWIAVLTQERDTVRFRHSKVNLLNLNHLGINSGSRILSIYVDL
jgi:hypothetical protein